MFSESVEFAIKVLTVAGVGFLPVGEVMFAAPLGIVLGLSVPVAFLAAAAGNVGAVILIVLGLGRWQRIRGLLLRGSRARRAERFVNRYGTAGLAVQAPVLSGTSVAGVIGLLLGQRPWLLAGWLTASILAWGLVFTVLAAQGRALTLSLFGGE